MNLFENLQMMKEANSDEKYLFNKRIVDETEKILNDKNTDENMKNIKLFASPNTNVYNINFHSTYISDFKFSPVLYYNIQRFSSLDPVTIKVGEGINNKVIDETLIKLYEVNKDLKRYKDLIDKVKAKGFTEDDIAIMPNAIKVNDTKISFNDNLEDKLK